MTRPPGSDVGVLEQLRDRPSGPGDAGLHRLHPDALGLGDLLVAHVGVLPEHQRGAEVGGQTGERPSDRRHRGDRLVQRAAERAVSLGDLVDRVVSSFDNCDNPRLKQIMQSLTVHLHNFIRDVRLTEEEWNYAIDFLTKVGHITDDKRQEFILLSDTLGLSMLVDAINHRSIEGATETTVLGPFYVPPLQVRPADSDISGDAEGTVMHVQSRVVTPDGQPIYGPRDVTDLAAMRATGERGLNGRAIFERLRQGDAAMRRVADAWLDDVAAGLIGLTHISNPEMLLLGGGVSAQQVLFVEPVRRRVLAGVRPRFAEGLRVEAATLGNDAGLAGAAKYFMDNRPRE